MGVAHRHHCRGVLLGQTSRLVSQQLEGRRVYFSPQKS